MRTTLLCLLAAPLLAGCQRMVAVGRYDPQTKSFSGAVVPGGVGGCPKVPAGFTEADLVGTWVGEPGSPKDTTLILRGDHTYQDIYVQEMGPDRYAGSGTERWWVEYRPSGVHLLHLTGMRFCHEDRDKPCAEKGPNRGLWFDFCEGVNILFHDEVVMVIRAVPPDVRAPRGIFLQYLVGEPDSITTTFQLKE